MLRSAAIHDYTIPRYKINYLMMVIIKFTYVFFNFIFLLLIKIKFLIRDEICLPVCNVTPTQIVKTFRCFFPDCISNARIEF